MSAPGNALLVGVPRLRGVIILLKLEPDGILFSGGMKVGSTRGVNTFTQLTKWEDAWVNPRRTGSEVDVPDPSTAS